MIPKPRTITPADEKRLFAGLAVQPVLAGVVTVLGAQLFFPSVANAIGDPREVALGLALYVSIAALVITTLCVFPTVVWWVKHRRVSLVLALCFGLGFGNLPFAVLVALSGGNADLLRGHAFASVVGLVGAAAFWLIAIRGSDLGSGTESAA